MFVCHFHSLVSIYLSIYFWVHCTLISSLVSSSHIFLFYLSTSLSHYLFMSFLSPRLKLWRARHDDADEQAYLYMKATFGLWRIARASYEFTATKLGFHRRIEPSWPLVTRRTGSSPYSKWASSKFYFSIRTATNFSYLPLTLITYILLIT